MPRPPIERTVGGVPRHTLFKPAGVPARELEHLTLAVDELEAIRLVDLEGLSHEQAAVAMGVSRQTIGRVLEHGRAQVAEALVTGKGILIGGGQYRVEARVLCCSSCGASWTEPTDDAPAATCPDCGAATVSTCWHEGRHGDGQRAGEREPGKGSGGRCADEGRPGGRGGRRGGGWRAKRCDDLATTPTDASNERTE